MLRRLLMIQTVLYGVVYAFLAYLRVNDLGIYVSMMTLMYITTVLVFSPLPRRLRIVNIVIIIALLTAFLYFAIIRIMEIMGFP